MIKAPKWCSHAVPSPRGWVDPITGELYVSKRFGPQEIEEFNGETTEFIEEMYERHEPPQMLHEAPVNHKSLEDMTKTELQALAEQLGVSVAKNATKKILIEKLEKS
jgi:hypothetical protein